MKESPGRAGAIPELLHQDLETQFAGAAAWCDALDLELFIERRRNPLHFLQWRYHEMKAAGDGIKLRIDRGGVLKHFVDARRGVV